MSILVFEDGLVTRLYPITIGRPAYAISCGGYRLVDWLGLLDQPLMGLVRPHLDELQRTDYSMLARSLPAGDQPLLLVNARLVPCHSIFESLRQLLLAGRPGAVYSHGELAAAVLRRSSQDSPLPRQHEQLDDLLQSPAVQELPVLEAHLPLLQFPHDVVRYNEQTFNENLEFRLRDGDYQEVADGVFLAAGATLGQHVVSDTQHGPILLDRQASVGHYCFLSGPAYLGPAARVIEHAAIKEAVSLGHTTKIGGEVEASVIEPYTNKQHHGFLGHSYLGSWVNLGAGTCNSDLKNTYGQVNMEYRGEKVPTGMQFVGCIIGDYAKSAINTGIFTGKTIGACSMVYGFVTTNVPSFVNYARLFGQVTELPPEVMVATQQRMFLRRNVTQRPCDVQLLWDMYELTRDERQLAGEPLSL